MKGTKRLFAILLSAMMISTNALAEVPNKVVVIGNKAFDLEYANDPKNVEEIRNLLSQGKRVMIKSRNQWYNNNGETKAERYAPPRLIYKNVDGVIEEISTAYFEKQVSIVIGIESPNEIKVIFNEDVDKQLLTKENFKINGSVLGDDDELNFDEEKKILTIKIQEDIDLGKSMEISMKIKDEESVQKNVRIVKNQEDVDKIRKDEEFCDLIVMGNDIKLELKGILGNVFLSGSNIEISNLETTYLQMSENSDKITLKASKINNMNAPKSANIVLEETVVKNTQTTESKKTQTGGSGGGSNYVSPWIKAEIEKIDAFNYRNIYIRFKDEVNGGEDNVEISNFTLTQGDKNLPLRSIIQNGKHWIFTVDSELQGPSDKLEFNNKIIAGDKIIVNYNQNKENGLKIGSKHIKSFKIESEIVGEFQSVDGGVLEVKDGKTLNGSIDNENRIIEIYEDMTADELFDVIDSSAELGLMVIEDFDSQSTNALIIGQDGSIIQYSVRRVNLVTKIIMDSEISLKVGEEKILEAKVMPENVENKELTWKSSKSDVATVDKMGNVKALKEGVTTITATAKNGVKAECTVVVGNPVITVKDVEFTKYDTMQISFNEKIQRGSELQSLFRVYINDEIKRVDYAKLKDGVLNLSIDENLWLYNNEFSMKDTFQDGYDVKIEYIGGENGLKLGDYAVDAFEKSVVVSEEFASLDGKSIEIGRDTFPGDVVGNQIILFDSVNPAYFLEMLKIPEMSYVYTCNEYKNYLFLVGQDGSIKDYELVERPQNIKFQNEQSQLMKIGENTDIELINQNGMKLSLEVEGENIIEASLKNDKVYVNGVGEGTGRIRIIGQMLRSDGSTVQGKYIVITKEIIVTPVEVESIAIPSEIEIQEGDEYLLEANIYPFNSTDKKLVWSSADEKIATVDENGMVKAVSIGETIVIVESKNGVSDTCKVKVVEKIHRIRATVVGNKVQLILADISADQKEIYISIQNKENDNIAHFNKYNLVEGENLIEFELEKGIYEGHMNIDGLKKFKIDTFTVEADS